MTYTITICVDGDIWTHSSKSTHHTLYIYVYTALRQHIDISPRLTKLVSAIKPLRMFFGDVHGSMFAQQRKSSYWWTGSQRLNFCSFVTVRLMTWFAGLGLARCQADLGAHAHPTSRVLTRVINASYRSDYGGTQGPQPALSCQTQGPLLGLMSRDKLMITPIPCYETVEIHTVLVFWNEKLLFNIP